MNQQTFSSFLPVIASQEGGLGNKLCLYSAFLSWGLEHGVPLLYPAFSPFAQYFEGTHGMPLGNISSDELRQSPVFEGLDKLFRAFAASYASVWKTVVSFPFDIRTFGLEEYWGESRVLLGALFSDFVFALKDAMSKGILSYNWI